METTLISRRQSPWHHLGRQIAQSRFLILMIIPAVVFYFIFCYIPMYGILIAFTKYYPKLGIWGSLSQHFVGLTNFTIIFNNDPEFLNVIRNTLLIGVGKIVIGWVAAIVVALLINELRMPRLKKTSQIIVTFPHFLSWVVIAGFIVSLFSRTGVINDIIQACGGNRISFFADGNFFLGLIFVSDIWKEAGWSSIIYLATMAGISPELYEAADIDGATRLQKIWHITLPGIKATAVLLLILSVGGILSAGFDQIFNLYNPLVYDQVDILDTYIYRQTFTNLVNPGVGTAIGLFKSIVSFVLVLAVDRVAKLFGERGIL